MAVIYVALNKNGVRVNGIEAYTAQIPALTIVKYLKDLADVPQYDVNKGKYLRINDAGVPEWSNIIADNSSSFKSINLDSNNGILIDANTTGDQGDIVFKKSGEPQYIIRHNAKDGVLEMGATNASGVMQYKVILDAQGLKTSTAQVNAANAYTRKDYVDAEVKKVQDASIAKNNAQDVEIGKALQKDGVYNNNSLSLKTLTAGNITGTTIVGGDITSNGDINIKNSGKLKFNDVAVDFSSYALKGELLSYAKLTDAAQTITAKDVVLNGSKVSVDANKKLTIDGVVYGGGGSNFDYKPILGDNKFYTYQILTEGGFTDYKLAIGPVYEFANKPNNIALYSNYNESEILIATKNGRVTLNSPNVDIGANSRVNINGHNFYQKNADLYYDGNHLKSLGHYPTNPNYTKSKNYTAFVMGTDLSYHIDPNKKQAYGSFMFKGPEEFIVRENELDPNRLRPSVNFAGVDVNIGTNYYYNDYDEPLKVVGASKNDVFIDSRKLRVISPDVEFKYVPPSGSGNTSKFNVLDTYEMNLRSLGGSVFEQGLNKRTAIIDFSGWESVDKPTLFMSQSRHILISTNNNKITIKAGSNGTQDIELLGRVMLNGKELGNGNATVNWSAIPAATFTDKSTFNKDVDIKGQLTVNGVAYKNVDGFVDVASKDYFYGSKTINYTNHKDCEVSKTIVLYAKSSGIDLIGQTVKTHADTQMHEGRVYNVYADESIRLDAAKYNSALQKYEVGSFIQSGKVEINNDNLNYTNPTDRTVTIGGAKTALRSSTTDIIGDDFNVSGKNTKINSNSTEIKGSFTSITSSSGLNINGGTTFINTHLELTDTTKSIKIRGNKLDVDNKETLIKSPKFEVQADTAFITGTTTVGFVGDHVQFSGTNSIDLTTNGELHFNAPATFLYGANGGVDNTANVTVQGTLNAGTINADLVNTKDIKINGATVPNMVKDEVTTQTAGIFNNITPTANFNGFVNINKSLAMPTGATARFNCPVTFANDITLDTGGKFVTNANFDKDVNVSGKLNANGALAVKGDINVTTGKIYVDGVVLPGDATISNTNSLFSFYSNPSGGMTLEGYRYLQISSYYGDINIKGKNNSITATDIVDVVAPKINMGDGGSKTTIVGDIELQTYGANKNIRFNANSANSSIYLSASDDNGNIYISANGLNSNMYLTGSNDVNITAGTNKLIKLNSSTEITGDLNVIGKIKINGVDISTSGGSGGSGIGFADSAVGKTYENQAVGDAHSFYYDTAKPVVVAGKSMYNISSNYMMIRTTKEYGDIDITAASKGSIFIAGGQDGNINMYSKGAGIVKVYTSSSGSIDISSAAGKINMTPTEFTIAASGTGAVKITSDAVFDKAVTVSGNFTAAKVTQTSDARLKTNIQPITNALDKITQLNGVNYNLITDDSYNAGVIAQDVEQIIPEVVHVNADDIRSVDYSGLIPYLIESIKELQAEIKKLKGEV
ncbi:tail fiber domain-containing protein [Aeromonas veronii]